MGFGTGAAGRLQRPHLLHAVESRRGSFPGSVGCGVTAARTNDPHASERQIAAGVRQPQRLLGARSNHHQRHPHLTAGCAFGQISFPITGIAKVRFAANHTTRSSALFQGLQADRPAGEASLRTLLRAQHPELDPGDCHVYSTAAWRSPVGARRQLQGAGTPWVSNRR